MAPVSRLYRILALLEAAQRWRGRKVTILLGGKQYQVVEEGGNDWIIKGVPGRKGKDQPHVGGLYYLRPVPFNSRLTASIGAPWAPRKVYLTPTTSKGTKGMRSDERAEFPFDEMTILFDH